MNNYDIIKVVVKVLALAWIAALLIREGRKFRKQSKTKFNKTMKYIVISGLIGFFIFFAGAALWLSLNHIPLSWAECLKSAFVGTVLGIGIGDLIGYKTQNKKHKRKAT